MRRPSPDHWHFLKQGVSVKTTLRAFIPIGLWVLFITVFGYAFKAIVHVTGATVTAYVFRSIVELVSAMIAFKFFFEILSRGATREESIERERRA